MVKLIIGHKGSGKTKKMVELANESVQNVNGSVVFINKDSRLTTDLKYSIRFISMNDFDAITNVDEYIGFIYGIISQDHDIEVMYIDSLLKMADINLENLEGFLTRLNKIAEEQEINFVVSVSADVENCGEYINSYEVVKLGC